MSAAIKISTAIVVILFPLFSIVFNDFLFCCAFINGSFMAQISTPIIKLIL